jgi:hypothetical protein
MNNSSGFDSLVTDYAVCGKQPAHYSINSSAGVDNPAGALTSVVEFCPAGTSILGAGLYSTSSEVTTSVNELNADGEAVGFEANNSASDNTINADAVCGS